ncbi:MAG: GNAT family N-acetyltransferase [Rhodobacteraceae bacterium]|nr:MAG: GNAT family N-acetyltransferase [Paracoccaceae bacterium]
MTAPYDALAAVHAAAFASAGPRPWSAAEIANLAAARGGVLAVDAASPVRGFALARVAADEAELLTLAVSPTARRRGVGAALLDAVIGRSAAAGATRLTLEVGAGNEAALALYRRAGFAEVGRRSGYLAAGPDGDALIMLLVLEPNPSI